MSQYVFIIVLSKKDIYEDKFNDDMFSSLI